jgi:hypothetical protein
MKKILILMLSFSLICSLTACSDNKIQKLMTEGKYTEAKKIILKDEKRYGKYLGKCNYNIAKENIEKKDYITAYKLLNNNDYKQAKALKKEIEEHYDNQISLRTLEEKYNQIENDKKEKNKGKSFGDNFIEGSDYYLELGERIHSLGDGTNYSNQKKLYKEIFNKVPASQEEAKGLIDNINKYVMWDINRFPIYYISLIFDLDDVCKSKADKDSVTITISNMHKFLTTHQISESSFAKMLAFLSMYGPKFTFNNNDFSLKWIRTNVNRGYYFCRGNDPNTEDTEEYKWFDNQLGGDKFIDKLEVISEENNSIKCKINITNTQFDFRIFALEVLWLDENQNVIGNSFNKSDDIHKTGISYIFEIPSDAEDLIFYASWETYD